MTDETIKDMASRKSLACMNHVIQWGQKYDATSMIHEYPIPKDLKEDAMIAVKAQMGLGKTEQLVRQLSNLPAGASALVVTHSRVFSNKMKADLEALGFKCYLDMEPGIISEHRVVCCLDSVPRLKLPVVGGYNIVIIDEVLSMLGRVTSDFMPRDEVYAALEHILFVSPVLLFMDAYVDNNFCYQFIQHLESARNGKCTWIWNTHITQNNRKPEYVLNRVSDRAGKHKRAAIKDIIDALYAGNKVVVPTSSRGFVNDVLAELDLHGARDKFKIGAYTRDTPKKVIEDAIKDCHAAWQDLDLLIYSPSITSGISFKLPHFDCLIAYMVNDHRMPQVDSCMQQMFRVRQLSDVNGGRGWNMRIYINDTRRKNIHDLPLDLGILEDDQDKTLSYKLGAFQDGDWELPEYLKKMEGVPNVPRSCKLRHELPTYDKDRLSWTMLIGMMYMRNKSALYFTDLIINAMKEDYGLDGILTIFEPEDEENANTKDVRTQQGVENLVIPFCNEVRIDKDTYAELVQNGKHKGRGHEDNQCVLIPLQDTLLKIPRYILHHTQVFLFKMAYEMYKIQGPVDKQFFDTYIIDATTDAGQKNAIRTFYTWLRACSMSRDINENRARFAQKAMQIKNLSDFNFRLFYADDANKYHLQLILGQELLLSLLGSYEEIKKLESEECKVCLPKETFKERLHAYISEMSEKQLAGIVHAFEFHSSRHESKEGILASKKGACYFAKKILSDAFAVALCSSRWEISLDGSSWAHLMSMVDQPAKEQYNSYITKHDCNKRKNTVIAKENGENKTNGDAKKIKIDKAVMKRRQQNTRNAQTDITDLLQSCTKV